MLNKENFNRITLLKKDDLNVRVSVFFETDEENKFHGPNWIKKICEALDESDSNVHLINKKYSTFKLDNDKYNYYTFVNSDYYTIYWYNKKGEKCIKTLNNVSGKELISTLEIIFHTPTSIRIDSNYCSWIIYVL